LEKNEIVPVIGSLQKPGDFEGIVVDSDVIVHAAMDFQANPASLDRHTVDLVIDAAKNSAQPKTLIFTSGTWVYGDNSGQSVDENSQLAVIQEIAWWPMVEQAVLNAEAINGLVIRPGVVYGKSGGMTGMWFEGASNGNVVQIVGEGNNHWAMVHIDDLALAYLLAAQSGLNQEVFNIVDNTQYTVIKMASAAAQAAGNIRQFEFVPLDEAKKEMGSLAEALALDQIVDATKAHRLLKWQPNHKGFILEVDTYYRAWKAHQT
jgi:nucleoside-diphosphate-sugar epimerase